MSARKAKQAPKAEEQGAALPPAVKDARPASKAPSDGARPADTGQPGGGQGRVDVTGIMPKGIRVDPNLTEGHPGYEESGDSEIIPIDRLTEGGGSEDK